MNLRLSAAAEPKSSPSTAGSRQAEIVAHLVRFGLPRAGPKPLVTAFCQSARLGLSRGVKGVMPTIPGPQAPPQLSTHPPNYPPDSTDADSDPADATRGYPPDSTDDSNSLIQIASY
jgi:hypothetical protein